MTLNTERLPNQTTAAKSLAKSREKIWKKKSQRLSLIMGTSVEGVFEFATNEAGSSGMTKAGFAGDDAPRAVFRELLDDVVF